MRREDGPHGTRRAVQREEAEGGGCGGQLLTSGSLEVWRRNRVRRGRAEADLPLGHAQQPPAVSQSTGSADSSFVCFVPSDLPTPSRRAWPSLIQQILTTDYTVKISQSKSKLLGL